MNDPFAIAASLVSALVLASSLRYLKRRSTVTFFHVATIALLLTNGIGVAFSTDVVFDVAIPPMTDASLRRASISLLLFCAVIFGLERMFYSNRPTKPIPRLGAATNKSRQLWAILSLSLGIAFILGAAFRFLILNQAIDFLAGAFVRSYGQEHYDVRRELSDIYVGAGRGAYLASVAMFIFCPTIISVLVFLWIRTKKYLALLAIIVIWAIQVCLALVFGQRAPLLFCIVQPLATWIFAMYSKRLKFLFGRPAILVGCTLLIFFTIVGGVIYQVTDDKEFGEGVQMLYSRVFIVPIQTSGFIYDIFPESVPFRGLTRVANMGNVSVMSDDINFADVSEIMTGYRYDANSCMIPVAYSGFGYLGVVAIAIIYFFYCWIVDRFVARKGDDAKALAITSSLYTLVAISNVPLVTAAFIYGFGVSAIGAVWLYEQFCISDQRRESSPVPVNRAGLHLPKPPLAEYPV